MEYIQDFIALAKAYPRASVALGLALIGLYLAARRKPRLMRDAEQDFERLRETRTGTYDDLRPLR
jgi:hypothetical protein